MLDATDLAAALAVPCPLTACAAFCGEECVSYVTGRPVAPHQHRLVAAGVIASPPAPIPAETARESA